MAESVADKAPQIRQISFGELRSALRLGWADYRAAPLMGLVTGVVCVLGGWLLYVLLYVLEAEWLAIPLTISFPLLGPFAAVGHYEVSRRLEAGERGWSLRDIWQVIWGQRRRQLPSMIWLIITYFLFWGFFAHMLFALFIGPSALTNITSSYAFLLQPQGLSLLLIGTATGFVFAALLFSLTVIALPLLLDRELDFVTAMLTSLAVVRENFFVMTAWAAIIAGLTFLALLPALLGLLVIFPVLGHASWHIYRFSTMP